MITNILVIVAATLFMEAAGESTKGKIAVASVIYNRAIERNQNFDQVCLAPKQFSCWNEGKSTALKKIKARVAKGGADAKAWKECLKIANSMVNKKFKPTTKADHYFATSIKAPKWASKMKLLATIGGHIFYRS